MKTAVLILTGLILLTVALLLKETMKSATGEILPFNLVDPETAPEDLKADVMYGYQIMNHTFEILPDFTNGHLTCSNCHFAAGNTSGGKNGGIALTGVSAAYPAYSSRDGRVISLAERINNCFKKSMNGKPIPESGKEMVALLSYLAWISKDIPIYSRMPWEGLSSFKTSFVPDENEGKRLYTLYCAECHKNNGSGLNAGTERIPPLWGEYSFNDAAGMNTLEKLSSFIYYNMPFQEPELSREKATHIAEYIRQRPRPKYKSP